MKRHSEDLLWADDVTRAEKVLRFLKLVTADRRDDSDINNIYKGMLMQRPLVSCKNVR